MQNVAHYKWFLNLQKHPLLSKFFSSSRLSKQYTLLRGWCNRKSFYHLVWIYRCQVLKYKILVCWPQTGATLRKAGKEWNACSWFLLPMWNRLLIFRHHATDRRLYCLQGLFTNLGSLPSLFFSSLIYFFQFSLSCNFRPLLFFPLPNGIRYSTSHLESTTMI